MAAKGFIQVTNISTKLLRGQSRNFKLFDIDSLDFHGDVVKARLHIEYYENGPIDEQELLDGCSRIRQIKVTKLSMAQKSEIFVSFSRFFICYASEKDPIISCKYFYEVARKLMYDIL